MGKYFISGETVRVEFPDGQWAEIKEELTQADQDFILNQMARANVNGGKSPSAEIDLGRLSLLERSVTAWSFADDDGKPVPVNRDSLSNLRRRYREPILQRINDQNEGSTEFRKN